MSLFLMTLAAVVLLALAAYAHYSIPAFTAGSHKVLLTRAILVVLGIALGSVSAAINSSDPLLALLSFLVGFGVVHFPAALILFFKHGRGEGKS
jgi:hypothetical protein